MLEQRGKRLLDREQAKRQADQRVEFLNLRFERGNAIRFGVGDLLSRCAVPLVRGVRF